MTTINNVEDLIRVLDENPQWLEILRARILTREVLELPQRLAEFAVASDRRAEQHEQANNERFDSIDRRFGGVDRRFDALEQKVDQHQEANNARFDGVDRRFDALEQKVDQHQEANNARFDGVDRRFDALEQKVDQHQEANNARFDGVDRRFDALEQKVDQHQEANNARFDGIDRHLRSVDNDLGYLKGSHARYAALEDAAVIAEMMGFDYIKSLTRLELYRMVRMADTTDIPSNVLDSFRYADLVMEATDTAGETCYIAVEISFTVDARDTGRALRNADLLTRFTGKAAQAAVAGLNRDNEVGQQIESGAVFWHQLSRNDLEAE